MGKFEFYSLEGSEIPLWQALVQLYGIQTDVSGTRCHPALSLKDEYRALGTSLVFLSLSEI